MDAWLVLAVALGAIVPTSANAVWEWRLAKGTRAYVDRRVAAAEAKAQKDRDAILAEATATRERVEALITALQSPTPEAQPASPGFAHGMVDPVEAAAKREEKKLAKMQRRAENAAAIAEAVGEKAVIARKVAEALGVDFNSLLDSESTEYAIGVVKKMVGANAKNSNGTTPVTAWR